MTIDEPLFSLITVTRENCAGLAATGRSLPPANRALYEWLVVDGASGDGTLAYLKGSAARWSSAPDSGLYDAMNKGLSVARGAYVLFLNAGDRLAPGGVLETLAAVLRLRPRQPDFIYADALEDGGFVKPARPHGQARAGMFTHHQAMLYHRDIVTGLRFDERYRIAADYKFTLQALARPSAVFYWPRPLCVFEPGGLSQRAPSQGRREQARIRSELGMASAMENFLVGARQSAAWRLRARFPGLYRRLRAATYSQ